MRPKLEIGMSTRRSSLVTGFIAVVLLATACGEAGQPFPTAPSLQRTDGSSKLLGGLTGSVTQTLTNLLFPPIKRTTPLANDVVWSFTAGPAGATNSNPAVGLKI